MRFDCKSMHKILNDLNGVVEGNVGRLFFLTGVSPEPIIVYRYRNTIEPFEDELFKWIETFLLA